MIANDVVMAGYWMQTLLNPKSFSAGDLQKDFEALVPQAVSRGFWNSMRKNMDGAMAATHIRLYKVSGVRRWTEYRPTDPLLLRATLAVIVLECDECRAKGGLVPDRNLTVILREAMQLLELSKSSVAAVVAPKTVSKTAPTSATVVTTDSTPTSLAQTLSESYPLTLAWLNAELSVAQRIQFGLILEVSRVAEPELPLRPSAAVVEIAIDEPTPAPLADWSIQLKLALGNVEAGLVHFLLENIDAAPAAVRQQLEKFGQPRIAPMSPPVMHPIASRGMSQSMASRSRQGPDAVPVRSAWGLTDGEAEFLRQALLAYPQVENLFRRRVTTVTAWDLRAIGTFSEHRRDRLELLERLLVERLSESDGIVRIGADQLIHSMMFGRINLIRLLFPIGGER